MNKIKILFVITQSELGGAQRWLFDTVTNLDKNKYEIVVASQPGPLLDKLTIHRHSERSARLPSLRSGVSGQEESKKDSSVASLSQNDGKIKIVSLKYLIRSINPVKDFLALIEIYRLIKKERPGILQLCSTKAGIVGSVAGKLAVASRQARGLKIVYRIGGWAFNDPRPRWQNWLFLQLEKLTAPLKDKIIVNSQKGYNEAIQHHITTKEKLILIYNGIDIKKQGTGGGEDGFQENLGGAPAWSDRSAVGGSDQRRAESLVVPFAAGANGHPVPGNHFADRTRSVKIGCIANNYPTKGLKYLDEAVKILEAKSYKLEALVIGQDSEIGPKDDPWQYFRSFANAQDDEGHAQDDSDMGIDIFVIPSVKEGLPYVLLEAMAHGLPIVATTVGGIPEIITDKKNGLLVPPQNSQALADAIETLINNPTLAHQLGHQAKEDVKQYGLEKMISQIDQLYQNTSSS